ncbi:hypothetical protein [Pedobacter kyonggii]|uniref:Uncharacterized protein n=1 Tax=Pedobacter kyonggii TaxID=1926871 RepID=A0A4Q9HAS9_9SPHI|nr:hypothetical protein [Pedobacter kyonggii]TBO41190.1 hypothetical protein EYS08_15640 [Pedobacter kyonggii]
MRSLIYLVNTFPDLHILDHFETQSLAVKSFINIQTCAFIDEYNFLFTIKLEDDAHLQEAEKFKEGLKLIVGPAVKVIKSYWKDLRKERNRLLAHNWRDGKDAIMFGPETEVAPNIPWIDEEYTLLIGIFDKTIFYLKKYRPDYFKEMDSYIRAKSQNKIRHRSPVSTHDQSISKLEDFERFLKASLEYIENIEW